MPIFYDNDTTISSVYYDNTKIDTVYYDNVKVYTALLPAVRVTNFSASDGITGYVNMYFTSSVGNTYSLYRNGVLIANSCYNGYRYTTTGTATYYLISHGEDGTSIQSNSDSGTGIALFGTHSLVGYHYSDHSNNFYGYYPTHGGGNASISPSTVGAFTIRELYVRSSDTSNLIIDVEGSPRLTISIPTGESVTTSSSTNSTATIPIAMYNYFRNNVGKSVRLQIIWVG